MHVTIITRSIRVKVDAQQSEEVLERLKRDAETKLDSLIHNAAKSLEIHMNRKVKCWIHK